jgi:hypothetical protein
VWRQQYAERFFKNLESVLSREHLYSARRNCRSGSSQRGREVSTFVRVVDRLAMESLSPQEPSVVSDLCQGRAYCGDRVLDKGRGIEPVSWKRTEGCFGVLGMCEGAAEMRRDCDGHDDRGFKEMWPYAY